MSTFEKQVKDLCTAIVEKNALSQMASCDHARQRAAHRAVDHAIGALSKALEDRFARKMGGSGIAGKEAADLAQAVCLAVYRYWTTQDTWLLNKTSFDSSEVGRYLAILETSVTNALNSARRRLCTHAEKAFHGAHITSNGGDQDGDPDPISILEDCNATNGEGQLRKQQVLNQICPAMAAAESTSRMQRKRLWRLLVIQRLIFRKSTRAMISKARRGSALFGLKANTLDKNLSRYRVDVLERHIQQLAPEDLHFDILCQITGATARLEERKRRKSLGGVPAGKAAKAMTDKDIKPILIHGAMPTQKGIAIHQALRTEPPAGLLGDHPRLLSSTEVVAATSASHNMLSGDEIVFGSSTLGESNEETVLELLGDDEGLWGRAKTTNGQIVARHEQERRLATGWHMQLPTLFLDDPHADPADVPLFRPGPRLRELLCRQREGADRDIAPRGYILTVGESALRNLLGWNLGECSARLAELARKQGLETVEAVTDLLAQDDALETGWLVDLHLGGREWSSKSMTLAKGLENDCTNTIAWGAELDTLLNLQADDLTPTDGDLFLLVPTATATSLFAARIIERVLQRRFPRSTIELHPCDAMYDVDGETRSSFLSEPLERVFRHLDFLASELLALRGIDPVLIASGGTKWEAGAVVQAGLARRLPVVYKVDRPDAVPWIARFDRFRPISGLAAAKISTRPGVAMTVGTSLLLKFRQAQGDRNAVPSVDELTAWLREQSTRGETWRLCAELTGLEAWIRRRALGCEPAQITIGLCRSDSDEGKLCADVIATWLKDQRYVVKLEEGWVIPDFGGDRDQEKTETIVRKLFTKLGRCIDETLAEPMQLSEDGKNRSGPTSRKKAPKPEMALPDVLFGAGRKLASALFLVAANRKGAAAFFAPDAGPDEEPSLWRVRTGGPPDPQIEIVPVP